MSDGGVSRTAPTTSGLSIMLSVLRLTHTHEESTVAEHCISKELLGAEEGPGLHCTSTVWH